jgi:hypothetical protein
MVDVEEGSARLIIDMDAARYHRTRLTRRQRPALPRV